MQEPSIGRIIHFVRDEQHVPGIINAVHGSSGAIGAMTFPYNGAPIQVNTIDYDEEAKDSSWHWPERVD